MEHTLLDYYKAIENASQKMLDAARSENWDQVVHLEGACTVLIAQLRSKARDKALDPEERKEKTRIMQRILRTDAEIRNLAEDDPQALLARIRVQADRYLQVIRKDFSEADIAIEVTNSYPPLGTDPDSAVTRLVQSLGRSDTTIKVAFGTEGGLFSTQLGVPTVVCGPGSMAQGHKPDEYVEVSQIERCDAMLATLVDRLAEGL